MPTVLSVSGSTESVAGLEIDEELPAYKHSIIAPQIGGNLTWAKGTFASVYGDVVSSWKVEETREGKVVALCVEVPANTRSTIQLMKGAEVISSDGLSFAAQKGILQAEAGSGTYRIRFSLS